MPHTYAVFRHFQRYAARPHERESVFRRCEPLRVPVEGHTHGVHVPQHREHLGGQLAAPLHGVHIATRLTHVWVRTLTPYIYSSPNKTWSETVTLKGYFPTWGNRNKIAAEKAVVQFEVIFFEEFYKKLWPKKCSKIEIRCWNLNLSRLFC